VCVRSSQLPLDRYDTDKIANRYVEQYDSFLESWLDKKIVLLELGVLKGGSLLLWRDYFPLGTIVGVDISLPKQFKPTERVYLYEGSQADPEFLSRIANEMAPDGFDIIIDDASHIGELTKIAFWHLFDHHLKPNGLYVIEDWGTGYWGDWPDGKNLDLRSYAHPYDALYRLSLTIASKLRLKTPMRCHSYGMVGFIKQLVDEQALGTKFKGMTINRSIVFIRKSDR